MLVKLIYGCFPGVIRDQKSNEPRIIRTKFKETLKDLSLIKNCMKLHLN